MAGCRERGPGRGRRHDVAAAGAAPAVVVLVGAAALGKAWFGLALVLAYGAGPALTLVLASGQSEVEDTWPPTGHERRPHATLGCD